MLATVSTLGCFGCPVAAPGAGVAPVVGPVVELNFVLQLAGPVPHELQNFPPQGCQNSTPNVALQVQVVDQNGVAVDLSAATGILLWLLAPDGTTRLVPAKFVSNGLDGILQYVTTAQDLNEAGLWQVQAQATFGTQVLLTAWGSFQAFSNIVDE